MLTPWMGWQDQRAWALAGALACVGCASLMAQLWPQSAWVWMGLCVLCLSAAAARWWWQRRQAQGAGLALEHALDAHAKQVWERASPAQQAALSVLRQRTREAVQFIQRSRLGEASGKAALYELPWYAVIGNPAAGKTSAVLKSGLSFPCADARDPVIEGMGGTRHCDWYFSSEGILLDTAGRYAVQQEDRAEWLGFLDLLKQHRPQAPLNGLIVVVSVAELLERPRAFALSLAHQLRQRMHELSERLEVGLPVYVLLSKADLIAGFVDFFEDRDRSEREQVWGATFAYERALDTQALNLFGPHFDALCEGLEAASVSRLSQHQGEPLPPGVLGFPLEFAAIKPALSAFVEALFEDNPYQARPIFRGFYFTSALQEGHATGHAREQLAQRFGLQSKPLDAAVYAPSGFFLKGLFSQVIFADRQLVKQHLGARSRRKRRFALWLGVLLWACVSAAWVLSYWNNRTWVSEVERDVQRAERIQAQGQGLAWRLDALEILQKHLPSAQSSEAGCALSMSWGLCQKPVVLARLKEAYFAAIQAILLEPSALAMAQHLQGLQEPAAAQAWRTPSETEAVYNALKAYLMLGERQRLERVHLGDQLPRFWRTWLDEQLADLPRAQRIQRAERILSFALSQLQDPHFPQLSLDLALVEQTRTRLRQIQQAMPLRDRLYAEIKAQAATRFAPITVASLLSEADRGTLGGSESVSGVFTEQAWLTQVRPAIEQAARQGGRSHDWVLQTGSSLEPVLAGNPELMVQALTQQYQADSVQAWQRFVQGVRVQEAADVPSALAQWRRLSDPLHSPLTLVWQAVHQHTRWEAVRGPALASEGLWLRVQRTLAPWLGLSMPDALPAQAASTQGVSLAFSGVSRSLLAREGGGTLWAQYLLALSRVQARMQTLTRADAGVAARQWLLETLASQGELAEALKLVDATLLDGVSQLERQSLRPLLVRPLMQAFAVTLPLAEAELNRQWAEQVSRPFEARLAHRYPFDRRAVESTTPAEVATVFGPAGSVARFVTQGLAGLIVQHGESVAPRTWGDLGVRLRPEFVAGLPAWVGPLGDLNASASAVSQAAGAEGSSPQTVFQILPLPAPGFIDYSLEVDGQQLHHQHGQALWHDWVWPGPGAPGVLLKGQTLDGRVVVLFNETGAFGLEKLLASAQRRKLGAGLFELRWSQANSSVGVQLRIVSQRAVPAASGAMPALPGLVLGQEGVRP